MAFQLEGAMVGEIDAEPIHPHFTSHYPPLQLLAEYEAIVPGFANKLIKWTETQTAHRLAMEKLQVEGMQRRFDRGQLYGLIIGGLGLVSATVLGYVGSGSVATIVGLVSIGGPAAALSLARNLPSALKRKSASLRAAASASKA